MDFLTEDLIEQNIHFCRTYYYKNTEDRVRIWTGVIALYLWVFKLKFSPLPSQSLR